MLINILLCVAAAANFLPLISGLPTAQTSRRNSLLLTIHVTPSLLDESFQTAANDFDVILTNFENLFAHVHATEEILFQIHHRDLNTTIPKFVEAFQSLNLTLVDNYHFLNNYSSKLSAAVSFKVLGKYNGLLGALKDLAEGIDSKRRTFEPVPGSVKTVRSTLDAVASAIQNMTDRIEYLADLPEERKQTTVALSKRAIEAFGKAAKHFANDVANGHLVLSQLEKNHYVNLLFVEKTVRAPAQGFEAMLASLTDSKIAVYEVNERLSVIPRPTLDTDAVLVVKATQSLNSTLVKVYDNVLNATGLSDTCFGPITSSYDELLLALETLAGAIGKKSHPLSVVPGCPKPMHDLLFEIAKLIENTTKSIWHVFENDPTDLGSTPEWSQDAVDELQRAALEFLKDPNCYPNCYEQDDL